VVLGALLVVTIAFGVRDVLRTSFFPLDRQLLDFRAFYCGGQVVDAGADPSRLEPLGRCEHSHPNRFFARSPRVVLPYVLPGYDSAAFGLLARLPFPLAGRLFTALAIAALVASIALFARTLGVPPLVCAGALCLSAGLPSLILGQLVPFELLTVAATAALLRAKRDRWAGVAASTALAEPHVGAFVVVAVAALVPRARVTLAASCAALVALAIVRTSPASQLAYLTQLLPAHAFAETRAEGQYSLTFALTLLRIGDAAALAVGSAGTIVMLILAVAVAGALAMRRNRAAIAIVPAGCAVVGGTFVHLQQEALAVPAALLLFTTAPARTGRMCAGAGLVLLAIPWAYPCTVKGVLLLTLAACAITLWYVWRGSMRAVIACLAVCCACLAWSENHPPPAFPVPQISAWPPSTPVSREWREVNVSMARVDSFPIGEKLPTWIGLAAMTAAGLTVLRDGRRLRRFIFLEEFAKAFGVRADAVERDLVDLRLRLLDRFGHLFHAFERARKRALHEFGFLFRDVGDLFAGRFRTRANFHGGVQFAEGRFEELRLLLGDRLCAGIRDRRRLGHRIDVALTRFDPRVEIEARKTEAVEDLADSRGGFLRVGRVG
jgi:hypothetical protein